MTPRFNAKANDVLEKYFAEPKSKDLVLGLLKEMVDEAEKMSKGDKEQLLTLLSTDKGKAEAVACVKGILKQRITEQAAKQFISAKLDQASIGKVSTTTDEAKLLKDILDKARIKAADLKEYFEQDGTKPSALSKPTHPDPTKSPRP
jgi:lipopolysaccharide biosynthesis regulator YciM